MPTIPTSPHRELFSSPVKSIVYLSWGQPQMPMTQFLGSRLVFMPMNPVKSLKSSVSRTMKAQSNSSRSQNGSNLQEAGKMVGFRTEHRAMWNIPISPNTTTDSLAYPSTWEYILWAAVIATRGPTMVTVPLVSVKVPLFSNQLVISPMAQKGHSKVFPTCLLVSWVFITASCFIASLLRKLPKVPPTSFLGDFNCSRGPCFGLLTSWGPSKFMYQNALYVQKHRSPSRPPTIGKGLSRLESVPFLMLQRFSNCS